MIEVWLIVELTKSYTLRHIDTAYSYSEMEIKLQKHLNHNRPVYAIRAFV